MIEDDVIREVRAARDAYCRQFGYDLDAIVGDLQHKERTRGRQVVSFPPRRPVRDERDMTEDATREAIC